MSKLKFLTIEQKKSWIENGFVKIGNVFSEQEMQEISMAYDELFERKHRENFDGLESAWVGKDMKKEAGNIDYTVSIDGTEGHTAPGPTKLIPTNNILINLIFNQLQVKSIHNLQMHSGVFTKLITNKKLLDALEDVMGTQDILLHHTKAHIKPPENGAPYLMHQDYHYFPFKNHTMLAVFLHLDDTTPANGGLAVYPGSHKLGPLEDHGLTDGKGEEYHYADPKKYPLAEAEPISAKKGEIIMFSYLLLHGSYLNLSKKSRRMFLMQVRAADDEPTKDTHVSPCQNIVLRGKNIYRPANMSTRFHH